MDAQFGGVDQRKIFTFAEKVSIKCFGKRSKFLFAKVLTVALNCFRLVQTLIGRIFFFSKMSCSLVELQCSTCIFVCVRPNEDIVIGLCAFQTASYHSQCVSVIPLLPFVVFLSENGRVPKK